MKTKFDKNDPYHQILAGTMALFVEKFGYTTIELGELMDDVYNELYFVLKDLEKEREKE